MDEYNTIMSFTNHTVMTETKMKIPSDIQDNKLKVGRAKETKWN